MHARLSGAVSSFAVLLLLASGCRQAETPVCDPACGPNGACVVTGPAAACVCFPGFGGADCRACATGFQDADGDGACKPSCASIASCGPGGTCSDTTGTATCRCADGLAGATCTQCAAGYQDNDRNGTCEPSCALAAMTCSGHGVCVDADGSAGCDCDPAYDGADCGACASGFQDTNGDGTCELTCQAAMRDCGVGGACNDSSGVPTCTCAAGYTGASCAQCAPGFQDHDSDNSCLPACSASACSGHGSCADTSGRVTCTCSQGYTGARCAECAAGFQDHDGDGACTATCATAALTCASYAACDDQSGTARCGCVAGFDAVDGGAACAYDGGLRDPSFIDAPAGAWSFDGGWSLDAMNAGTPGGDPGIVRLSEAGRMSSHATLTQTFLLAGVGLRDGLSLNVLTRDNCTTACARTDPDLAVSLNGLVSPIPTITGTSTICIGEGALGPTTTLSFASMPAYGRTVAWSVDIDRVSITPDANCPPPRTMLNGDFEAAGGWTGAPSGGATFTIGTGAVNGTRAARLATTTLCQGVTATGRVSVPPASVMPRAALQFSMVGSFTGGSVSIGGRRMALLRGATTPATTRLCLPDGFHGRVVDVLFSLDFTGGLCATADVRTMDLDDVRLVDDPSCPASAAVPNGGFEEGGLGVGWFGTECSGSACITTTKISTTPSQARTGNGSLQLTAGQRCSVATASTTVTVPPSDATGGPALRFFYKLPTLAASASVNFDGYGSSPLPVVANYSGQIICLDPRLANRVTNVDFVLNGTAGTCAETYGPDVLSIDDVSITTDAACPR